SVSSAQTDWACVASPSRAVITIRWSRDRRPMRRTWIIGSALALALATPAVAQQRAAVPEGLARLPALCHQQYRPACIKRGFVIASIPPPAARQLRRDHPEWWWWERW